MHQAVWLLLTAEFRRRAFESRGSTWDIPSKTSDPERALANMFARDELFTRSLYGEVSELGLSRLEMDGRHDVTDSARLVARALDLRPFS